MLKIPDNWNQLTHDKRVRVIFDGLEWADDEPDAQVTPTHRSVKFVRYVHLEPPEGVERLDDVVRDFFRPGFHYAALGRQGDVITLQEYTSDADGG